MTTVLALLLIAVAAGFVVWPLVRESEPEVFESDPLSTLQVRKQEALHGLKEADFDLQMGKLTEADHALLQQRLRQQALEAIAALEGGRPAEGAASSIPARGPRRVSFCPSCGTKVPPKAKFCGGCGTDLKAMV